MSVTVRPLERSEWEMLRDLRLFALQSETAVEDELHYELPLVRRARPK